MVLSNNALFETFYVTLFLKSNDAPVLIIYISHN